MKEYSLSNLLTQKYYPLDEIIECDLPDTALKIIEDKYLQGETPEKMFARVAKHVGKGYQGKLNAKEFEQMITAFYNIMASRDFMPNSPTLMNAGRPLNQLAACFVVPVGDSMEGIFREAVGDMALIQRTGGGTGFDFSSLRPAGAKVSSTNGESSGPIPFMRAFNACTETVKQGGARRGANMGILRVDHPDIREFITLKSDPNEMNNFNLSVAITDDFMKAVKAGQEYDLVHEGTVYGKENAREIYDLIAKQAWTTGEPGVVFIDEINRHNTLPGLGNMTATNPCGEQPLLPYEACNLGSINLKHMVSLGTPGTKEKARLDLDKLRAVTTLAVLFLDCVIDAGDYPLPQITDMVKSNRKIGLGVMGFADVCFMLEIGYDSPEAVALAEMIMAVINSQAHKTSEILAQLPGLSVFPNFHRSALQKPRRNATCTTIAPTGTIALIAGASYGVEPAFALTYSKTLADTGEVIQFINQHVSSYMSRNMFPTALKHRVEQYILEHGSVQNISASLGVTLEDPADRVLLEPLERIFVTAQDIAPVDHVHIQAAFQKNTDNAVSKTINFQNNVSPDDIKAIFDLAYRSKCKGITVYRDGCRDNQPLTVDKKSIESSSTEAANWSESERETQEAQTQVEALKRPQQLYGITRQIPTGCGMMLVTVNMDEDNEIFEVLMRAGSSGGCSAYTDAVARLISISLRHGVPLDVLIDQLRSVRCDNFRYQSGRNPDLKGKSCPDVVGKFMQDAADGQVELGTLNKSQMDAIKKQAPPKNLTGTQDHMGNDVCPMCMNTLNQAEGCVVCSCGYSRC